MLPGVTLEGLFNDRDEVHEGGVDRSDVVRVRRTNQSLVGILLSWVGNNVWVLEKMKKLEVDANKYFRMH